MTRLLSLFLLAAAPAWAKTCEITAYGAVADDDRLDDAAIARAIDDCAPSGGKVRVPAGVFLTGGVQLKSNVEFHLSGGAVLRGAPRLADYRTVTGMGGAELERGEDDAARGVLFAIGVTDVAITGTGTLDGAGAGFWKDLANRPDMTLGIGNSRRVRVRDIRLIDPAKYHSRVQASGDVVLDGVTILAPALSPNSDGVQVRDSSDVTITNCRIDTGDDAVVLKAHTRPVERVIVSNCVIASDDGAVKFGTGSHTAIRDSLFTDLVIHRSRFGIALFMQDGGVYENNRFSGIRIATGGRHAREYPIYVDIDTRDGRGRFGTIRGLTFEGIDITTRGNVLIGGQPGAPVSDLRLTDVAMRVENAVDLASAPGAKPRGNRLQPAKTGAADFSKTPAHIVLGHVDGAVLRGVDVRGVGAGDRRARLATPGSRGVEGEAWTEAR